MSASAELFSNHLGLAQIISLEYTNIPGAQPSESLSEAQRALFRASEVFDPTRGEFSHYAAKAVRNALNSFYAKSLKHAQIFPKSLDEAPDWNRQISGESAPSTFGTGVADSAQDVFVEVRKRESNSILDEILNFLSPRERIVVEGMRTGKSFEEIGDGMGISKQAAHKISATALQKLRDRLDFLGYRGLDSKGFLKSIVMSKKEQK